MSGRRGVDRGGASRTVVFVLRVCYRSAMKQVTLREANQQFSRLVREVEETGQRLLVLRNGKPAVEIAPAGAKRALRDPTQEQDAAFAAFVEAALKRPGNSKGLRRWTRDELHER